MLFLASFCHQQRYASVSSLLVTHLLLSQSVAGTLSQQERPFWYCRSSTALPQISASFCFITWMFVWFLFFVCLFWSSHGIWVPRPGIRCEPHLWPVPQLLQPWIPKQLCQASDQTCIPALQRCRRSHCTTGAAPRFILITLTSLLRKATYHFSNDPRFLFSHRESTLCSLLAFEVALTT